MLVFIKFLIAFVATIGTPAAVIVEQSPPVVVPQSHEITAPAPTPEPVVVEPVVVPEVGDQFEIQTVQQVYHGETINVPIGGGLVNGYVETDENRVPTDEGLQQMRNNWAAF